MGSLDFFVVLLRRLRSFAGAGGVNMALDSQKKLMR
jgi:hypothetical protein